MYDEVLAFEPELTRSPQALHFGATVDMQGGVEPIVGFHLPPHVGLLVLCLVHPLQLLREVKTAISVYLIRVLMMNPLLFLLNTL